MRSGIPWVTPVLPVTVSGLEVLLNSFLLVHPLMWLKPPAVGPPIPFFDIGGLWMILHRTIFVAYTIRSVDRGVDIRPPLGTSHGLGGHRVGLALFLLWLPPSALRPRGSLVFKTACISLHPPTRFLIILSSSCITIYIYIFSIYTPVPCGLRTQDVRASRFLLVFAATRFRMAEGSAVRHVVSS